MVIARAIFFSTTNLAFWPHAFMCIFLFSQRMVISINPLTFVTETQYVFCAVDTAGLHIHSFIHSFIHSLEYSILRQVHTLLQSEYSTQCDPLLLLLILLYPLLSLRSSCSCLLLLLRLSVTILVSVFPSVTCFRRQSSRKM